MEQTLIFRYLSEGFISLYFSNIILNFSGSTGLKITFSLTGYFSKKLRGRTGLFSNPPPQLGQTFSKTCSTQSLQKVHSKVQIMASSESDGSFLPQFSQIIWSSNIIILQNFSYFFTKPFQQFCIFFCKRIDSMAVNINLTNVFTVLEDWYYNFRFGIDGTR